MDTDAQSKQNTAKKVVGAAMVVGGGVAGIQAALDLANSGIKVYLVESASAIGGKMAQLDKTFPTNDCAMCTISPRLVECSRHHNISIITNADVTGLAGSVGDFRVSIRRRPRYIDPAKCTGCGDCAAKCPVASPSEYDEALGSRTAIHRRYAQAVPSTYTIDKKGRAPCKAACPAECGTQGYIALLAEGRYQEGIDLIRQTVPFASVCGRVCPAFCERDCRREQVDEPVAISSLKRFLADWEFQQGGPKIEPTVRTRDEKIAVIGAGPAGLTAAADLVRQGYGVTVFEALPVAGGMMRVGIPAFRLNREQLQSEIDAIVGLGVDLRLNTRVDDVDALLEDGYSAVFMATGAHRGKKLPIPGKDLPGVQTGTDFLRRIALGEKAEVGDKVLVIGGGNVAADVARSARRLGATHVAMACLESRETMPASNEEVAAAEAEGIEVFPSRSFVRVLDEQGQVTGVECREVLSAEFDSNGRLQLQEKPGSEHILAADTVIFAIGQGVELNLAEKANLATTAKATVVADTDSLATSRAGVFAGGDVVTGTTWIVDAIGAGHKAARAIDRFVRGELPLVEPEQPVEVVTEPVDVDSVQRVARQKMPALPHSVDSLSLDVELELGFSEEQARAEAARCLKCGGCSECYVCEQTCQAKAVNHNDREVYEDINVGAIVLAPGYDVFDASEAGEFGFGRYPNVLTGLQFERMLSASGPSRGHLERPSDKQEPRRIAFLQCVGSRDQKHPYCSSVCCMYASKQSMLAKEHAPGVECSIFLMDIRSFGKGFDAYVERAQASGVRYLHSRPSSLKQSPMSKNLIVRYQDDSGELQEEEFDLVVLSVGIVPGRGAQELARELGIELNEHGFCATDPFMPLDTNLPGVFACGPFREPMDIPESVTQASGTAAKALEILAPARGELVVEKEYPPEKTLDDEPRVGVFICHCGSNIGGVVDVESVRQYAADLPGVVYAERNLYTCSQDTQQQIKQRIEEYGINRVIVASCTPRTHESLFQDTIREVGLNPYLFEMANIRDQCSWVHGKDPAAATEKAKALIRMAVARAATLQPLHKQLVAVNQSALIVGAGVAGMNAALSLATQGFKVYLVEREARPGGMLWNLRYTPWGEDPRSYLRSLIGQVMEDSRIELLANTTVLSTSGFVGNFQTTVETAGQERVLDHGVTIIATGAREGRTDDYLLGQDRRVVTQLELEQMVAGDVERVRQTRNIVMIQCVGRESDGASYCSRICCNLAMKNALKLKEVNPAANIYVLFKDIRTYGFSEQLYTEARRQGVLFVRYDDASKPEVNIKGGELLVSVRDRALDEDLVIQSDLLVLAEPVVASEGNTDLSMIFKVTLTREGFFLEAHPKLRPVDFASEGLFICGSAHYPKHIAETIAQALATAGRASTILCKPSLEVGGVVAQVEAQKCAACLTCVRVCPYHVPRINEDGVAEINVAACQGCGTCAGECPAKAITLLNYNDEQVACKPLALLKGG